MKTWKIAVLVLILFACYLGLYYYPAEVYFNSVGYKFCLGELSQEREMESLNITLKGSLHKSLVEKDYFEGYLIINNEVYDGIVITPDEHGKDKLYYLTDNMTYGLYGDIYVNNDFSAFVITPYEADRADTLVYKWNNVTGDVIVAPAMDEVHALNTAKDITKAYREKMDMKWSFY